MHKNLMILAIIFILSLIISAIIFNFIEQGNISTIINYEKLKEYSYFGLFFESFKKNILYFILIITFTLFGLSLMIYASFSFITIIYGISMIYFVKIIPGDILYLILNLTDYLIYFPLLVFFTYKSILLSKNIKKVKTNLRKVDIIVKKHISFSILSLSFIIMYSLVHSFWIYVIISLKN